jgi:1-acyl-sn-glycerol-3-phosphate acyltransferase
VEEWNFDPAHDHGLPIGQQLRSVRRESGLLGKIGQAAWAGWVSLHLRALERIRVVGREHLPATPPFVIVANHGSHIDALVLASLLPRRVRPCTYPIAAGDTFFESPVRAAISANLLNALPVWRHGGGRHGIDALRDRLLGQPCGLILFPEGTRSRSGAMSPFKPGVGMLVAGRPVPVVPIHLSGTHAAWPPRAKLPRFGRTITAAVGPPLWFEEVSDDREGWAAVAAAAEAAVRELGACAR